jgi:serine/threonine-protein phosphatase 2A activator
MGTRAPWAEGKSPASEEPVPAVSRRQVPEPPPNRHTGRAVQPLIPAESALPAVRPDTWPERWTPAKKCITTPTDVQRALKGKTLHGFVSFTLALNDAVIGVKLSEECHVSRATQVLLDALEQLNAFCDQTPPVTHEVRYGNPSYRQWFQKMKDAAPEIVYNILGDELGEATLEILPYFLDSFGNCSRIDYGTGHETAFICFLYCLYALGALSEKDLKATVTCVFSRYILFMRKLQTTYWCDSAMQGPPIGCRLF